MRIILYTIIIILLFFAPVERLDVADLEPVQTVAASVENEKLKLHTDTGAVGIGTSADTALQKLEESTPGVIYLDTAEYLLLTEEALGYVDGLRQYLNDSVKVSLWDGEGSIEDAAGFLRVRKDLPKLENWKP